MTEPTEPTEPAGPAPLLPDGTYDAFVVDATAGDVGAMSLDVAITSGEHKGAMFSLTATGLAGSEIELLGMPATLTVADGRPEIRIDG